jgi:hypothetical protein
MGERERKTMGVKADGEFDPLAFTLAGRHDEPDAPSLKILPAI